MVVDRLPWYGYDNTCTAGTAPDARSCARGKSGAELGKAGEFFQELPLMLDPRHKDACDPPRRKCGPESFDRSLHTVLGLLANRSSPVMYDDHPDEQSPFFNYIDGSGTVHQLWFDSPASLRLRYDLARQEGLRGVSAWRNDMVDYSTPSAALCSRALWAAMVGAPPPPPGCPLDAVGERSAMKSDDGSAQPRPRNAKNITVFHVVDTRYQRGTGLEREWPVDQNTADLGGDIYFDLGWGQIELLECKRPLNFSRSRLVRVNCEQNAEAWDRSHLALSQLTLEIDSEAIGGFIGCDAMGANQTMDCHCSQGKDHGNEFCPATVGQLNLTEPDGTPFGVWGHGKNTGLTRLDYWRYNVADLVGGHWYSTPSSGLCGGPHASTVDGKKECTWRVAEVTKKVSRSCHDAAMFAAVEEYAARTGWTSDCFSKCANPRNVSDPCWIACYYDTMLGANSSTCFGGPSSSCLRGHMPINELEGAWLAPFRSSDPAKRGCPDLTQRHPPGT